MGFLSGLFGESKGSKNVEPVNENIVNNIAFFTKIGLTLVNESYDGGNFAVIFQKNCILISLRSDIQELYDSYENSDKIGNDEVLGRTFSCTLGEYKLFKRNVSLNNYGMNDIQIGIPAGQNSCYYDAVKDKLQQMYSLEVLEKVQFSAPDAQHVGTIQFVSNGK